MSRARVGEIFYTDGKQFNESAGRVLERGWYHYEEDYATVHGPYPTMRMAQHQLDMYCRFELGGEEW